MNRVAWMLCAASIVASGCSNEVGELLECAQVCESYDDCVADSADQTGCTDGCEAYADVSDANEEQVFACDDCLNELGDTCDSSCNAVCDGIIPAL